MVMKDPNLLTRLCMKRKKKWKKQIELPLEIALQGEVRDDREERQVWQEQALYL